MYIKHFKKINNNEDSMGILVGWPIQLINGPKFNLMMTT